MVILLKNMTSPVKFIPFRLSVLFLGAVGFFNTTRVHGQQAAGASPPGDAKVTSDAEFIAAADEVLGKMSEITGL